MRTLISILIYKLCNFASYDENIKMTKIVPKGWSSNDWVPVCENCLKGNHISYGINHMPPKSQDIDESILGRYSCKNIGKIDGRTFQCHCNAVFTELLETIKNK